MTKILSDLKSDVINKKGRRVIIKWTTDNDIVNGFLKTPRMYHHQFELNTTIDMIIAIFTDEAVPLVQNAEKEINKSMTGQTFEVEV